MAEQRPPDSWKKKQIEQTLVRDLHAAKERFRMASSRLSDLTQAHPDSTVELLQARAEYQRTQEALQIAHARWAAFIRHGAIPEDLGPNL